MPRRSPVPLLTAALAVCLFTAPLLAQQTPRKPEQREPTFVNASATVEQYMEIAIQNLKLRYSLNDEQTERTRAIMREGVEGFLRENEEVIWPAIRDMLRYQLGMNPPDDPAEIKRIGTMARPLMGKIQERIFDYNERWREILTPEQKLVHDYDLAEMRKTFVRIDENLGSWQQGVVPGDGIFPRQNLENSPPQPPKPSPGLPPPPDPVDGMFKPDMFDIYVEEFIKDYELDEGQIVTARSILKEFKAKAVNFREVNENELREIAVGIKVAQEDRDRDKLRELEARRKKALEPIHRLFEEMTQRLKAILSTIQLAKYEQRQGAESAKPEAEPAKRTPPADGGESPKRRTSRQPSK